jgi:FKBP-type peptidyl-prolyl cis-trans isomerase SlyD
MVRAVLFVLVLSALPLAAAAQNPPAAPAPSGATPAPPASSTTGATPAAPAPSPSGTAPAPPAPSTSGATAAPPAGDATAVIADGATVEIEYTLSDDAGAVLDSNKGQKPLTYTHGGQQIIAGLEKQLAGMHKGDEKKVTLKPDEAYGVVDPSAQAEVPKEAIPADALVVGAPLMARNEAGESRPVVVKEIKDKTVVIDLNHPLAGKTLVFDVKVLSVEPAKPATPRPGS